MKKTLAILLAVLMVCSLAACGGKTPENEPSAPASSDISTGGEGDLNRVLDYQASYYCCGNTWDFNKNKVIAVFRSEEEVAEYYSSMSAERYDMIFGDYDAAYFAENVLVIIEVLNMYETHIEEITSVQMDEQGIVTVSMDVRLPFDSPDLSYLWLVPLTLDNDISFNDITVEVNYTREDHGKIVE